LFVAIASVDINNAGDDDGDDERQRHQRATKPHFLSVSWAVDLVAVKRRKEHTIFFF
jgi:hypothetical protein